MCTGLVLLTVLAVSFFCIQDFGFAACLRLVSLRLSGFLIRSDAA